MKIYILVPNPCADSPCLHNGACIDESSSKEKGILMADRHDYKCFCTPGYRGKNCEGEMTKTKLMYNYSKKRKDSEHQFWKNVSLVYKNRWRFYHFNKK